MDYFSLFFLFLLLFFYFILFLFVFFFCETKILQLKKLWILISLSIATFMKSKLLFLNMAGIKSLDDLAEQRDVKYGLMHNSAEEELFANQNADPYKKMYSYMGSHDTFVDTIDEGIEKVRQSYGTTKGLFRQIILTHFMGQTGRICARNHSSNFV